jgi:transposase
MTRRSPYVITLSAADRAVLEKRSRSYAARHADVVRAKIVLLCADGHRNTAIASRLDVHVNLVRTWRKRFFEAGLDGLADRPRPGRPRSAPSKVPEVRAKDGEATAGREASLSQWSSTEPAEQAVAEGVVVPVTGPGATRGANRARGRRPARRSPRPPNAPAPVGQLIPLQSRVTTTTTLDALRHLVSSINSYLAEIAVEHAHTRARMRAPTGR